MDENPYEAPQVQSRRPLQNSAIVAGAIVVILLGIGFFLRGLPLIRWLWP